MLLKTFAIASILTLVPFAPFAVDTDSGPNIDNPARLLEVAAPEVLRQQLSPGSTAIETVASEQKTGARHSYPSNASVVKFNSRDGASDKNASITVNAARGLGTEVDGITVLRTESSHSRVYVQPLRNGVRLISAISSPEAPTEYSYTFGTLGDSAFTESRDGSILVQDPVTGLTTGRIDAPWAKDANGNALKTTYSWSDNVLTQKIDLSDANIAYPVVADPAWQYVFSYGLNSTTRPALILNAMAKCFNCYFPIEGAPHDWPQDFQFLPLVVRLAAGLPTNNFNCYFGGHYIATENGKQYFGFTLLAAPGHVDGAGSTVSFEVVPVTGVIPGMPDAQYQLNVFGYVLNDFGWFLNEAYKVGAQNTWAGFAHNITFITS